MRTCPGCGVEESRTKDAKGRDRLSLDPVSGLCVNCLVKTHTTFTSRRTSAEVVPFDSKAAQARNDE